MAEPTSQQELEQEVNDAAASNLEGTRGGEGLGGALDPDHPLLARAQRALKKQLENNKLRLDEELREKNIMLNVSASKHQIDAWFCCVCM